MDGHRRQAGGAAIFAAPPLSPHDPLTAKLCNNTTYTAAPLCKTFTPRGILPRGVKQAYMLIFLLIVVCIKIWAGGRVPQHTGGAAVYRAAPAARAGLFPAQAAIYLQRKRAAN